MSKTKFNLTRAPTFPTTVLIPIPGAVPEPIQFIFKGRTREEFKDFMEKLPGRDDLEVLMDIASGWDLSDPFDLEHVSKLHENYIGASRVIIDKYLAELTNARLGN